MNLFISTFIVVLSVLPKNASSKVAGYYCEFGFCDSDQYCCGENNKCCDKVLDMWYFWLGLGIVVFVVAAVIFFKYYMWKKKSQYRRYSLLVQTQS